MFLCWRIIIVWRLYLTKICDRNNTQYILCVKEITQDRNRFNIDS